MLRRPRSPAYDREGEVDDLLVFSLDHRGSYPVRVTAEDEDLAALHAAHTLRWYVVTAPLSKMIVAVLELGSAHLAWALTDATSAVIRQRLQAGEELSIRITSPSQPALWLTAPPLPPELRATLMTPFPPVTAA